MKSQLSAWVRHQFFKAAIVARKLHKCAGIHKIIVHDGHHLMLNMPDEFFEKLKFPHSKV